MSAITGQDGAVSIGGSAINGKVTRWRANITSESVKAPGMGDDWTERKHIRSDWRAEVEFTALDDADWDLHQGLVGTEAALALKRKSGDTNPYFTDTGLVTEAEVDAPEGDVITVRMVVESSDGSAGPTLDTSPAA